MTNPNAPAFPQPYPPQAFQKAMAFIDGTNLFYRLDSERIVIPSVLNILKDLCIPRELLRAYVYTSQPHLERAMSIHGNSMLAGCRIVLGDAIPTQDGNYREKAVDAQLVADLVYHAASRNCEYAFVLTHDTDFCHALRRVEDFGCRTAVVAVGTHAPNRLQNSCDRYIYVSQKELLEHKYAKEIKQEGGGV